MSATTSVWNVEAEQNDESGVADAEPQSILTQFADALYLYPYGNSGLQGVNVNVEPTW